MILSKWLKSYIWTLDGILAGTTSSDQSGPENNANEEVFHILKTSGLEPGEDQILVPHYQMSYTGHPF